MGIPYFVCVLAGLVWFCALICLCSRRDIEIHRKLTWVVTVLVLSVLGALIYFIFGPSRVMEGADKEFPIDPDAKPYVPPGESWNPILGGNHLPPGQGLNSKAQDLPDDR